MKRPGYFVSSIKFFGSYLVSIQHLARSDCYLAYTKSTMFCVL